MKECFGWTLQQYVYYGGYPGAARYINDDTRWRNYVKDSLIEPSISKDILMDTKIMKPQLLRQLFEIGSDYSGELLSLTKVAAQLQDAGNVTTLAGYLHLLDECGLLCGLQKYAEDDARKYNSVLAGIEAAAETGIDFVFADVKKTSDGVLILFADAWANRMLGVDKNIAEMTYAEISEYYLSEGSGGISAEKSEHKNGKSGGHHA